MSTTRQSLFHPSVPPLWCVQMWGNLLMLSCASLLIHSHTVPFMWRLLSPPHHHHVTSSPHHHHVISSCSQSGQNGTNPSPLFLVSGLSLSLRGIILPLPAPSSFSLCPSGSPQESTCMIHSTVSQLPTVPVDHLM